MASQDSVFASTFPGLLAFPVITEAQLQQAIKFREREAAKGNKQMREAGYETTFLMDPDHPDLPTMKQIIREVAAGNYDADLGAMTIPLKDGTKMADKRNAKLSKMTPPKDPDREFLRGKIALVARSKFPVAQAIVSGAGVVDLVDERERALHGRKFYAGAEALIQVRFAWYNPSPLVPGGGVNAYLQLVMVTGKGKPFPGTVRSAADAFKGYAGKVSNIDPRDGLDDLGRNNDLDDEIPF